MERMGGCSNGWAQSLDDQDVSQLLPTSGFNFELGVCMMLLCWVCNSMLNEGLQASWSSSERQHALGKDVLLLHPEDQVDSFNLYIKGTMLLSRVKAFNLRFRAKRFMGDPAYTWILQRIRKCGRRTMMRPEMRLLIHDELPASSRSTISRRCSGKASHCICGIQFAMVAWTRICIPLPLFPICT
jgi:hypothetical protein